MKVQTTQKNIKNLFGKNVFALGYCFAHCLLRGCEPFAYNSGIYGWNCDYYLIDGNTCICTGYRPHGTRVDYETMKKYDERAKEVYNNYTVPYDERMEKIAHIRAEWIEELRK